MIVITVQPEDLVKSGSPTISSISEALVELVKKIQPHLDYTDSFSIEVEYDRVPLVAVPGTTVEHLRGFYLGYKECHKIYGPPKK